MRDMLLIPLVFGLLYLGPGFFVTRFFGSRFRNNLGTMLFGSIVVSPLILSFISTFVDFSAWGAVWILGILTLCGIGIATWQEYAPKVILPSFAIGPEKVAKRVRGQVTLTVALFIALGIFVYLLALPKWSLVTTNGAAVWDDYNKVNVILSTGFSPSSPAFFQQPTSSLSYYHYGFLAPGIVFQTTPFSAQQAFFIHTILTYIGILSFFAYIAVTYFKKSVARIGFLASTTIMGGFEYYLYRLNGQVPPGHIEWWARGFHVHLNLQISSFSTLFLWVPHHLMGGVLIMLAILLRTQRNTRLNQVLVALSFAAAFGFSTFAFFIGAIAFFVTEIWLLVRRRGQSWMTLAFQFLLFLLFALRMIPLYLGHDTPIIVEVKRLHFLPLASGAWDAVLGIISKIAETVATMAFLYTIDIGIPFLLATIFLIMAASNRKARKSWTDLQTFLCVLLLIGTGILACVSTPGANDFFMRGVIPVQLAIVFFGASQLERISWKIGLPVLIGMCALQFAGFPHELRNLASYRHTTRGELYSFIATETPKDAVVFLEKDHTPEFECLGITFQANRLCFLNSNEVGGWEAQYAKIDRENSTNYHDMQIARSMTQFPDRYFLSTTPLTDNALELKFSTNQSFFYLIK